MEPEWIWLKYVGKKNFESYLPDVCKMKALSAGWSKRSSVNFISKRIRSILIGLQRRLWSIFLSEWREFPSAPCLSGEKKLDDSSRLDAVEIARVPDMLPSLFPSWSG